MTEEKRDIHHQPETGGTAGIVRRMVVPKVDIYETRGGIVILADMPGVGIDSLEVTVEKNVLAIKGTVPIPVRPGSYTTVYAERAPEEYRRNFTISHEVDRDKIEATVKNGVLRLTLHKVEPLKARKISVQAA